MNLKFTTLNTALGSHENIQLGKLTHFGEIQ
jgi:hypothetical protein